ncbi:MAG: HtaA domain-containing protein [Ancrocorticia sp.]|nr:HtaA domain-containing protein [Ancrocorticia sp.]MCI2003180.1 HtaA domain-containing protein [Ancrocorticia sp.]
MSSTLKERLLAVGAGVAVLLGGLSAGAAANADESVQSDATTTTWDGTLTWGLKASFINYLTSKIANGTVTATDGAALPNGQQSAADYTLAPGQQFGEGTPDEVQFQGTVQYTGHDGVLDVTLSDPVIDFSANVLKVTVSSREFAGATTLGDLVNYGEIAFASLTGLKATPGEDGMAISVSSAKLTEEGAQAFAGFYKEGEALDVPTAVLTKTVTETTPPVESETTEQAETSEKPSKAPEQSSTPTEEETTQAIPRESLSWQVKDTFIGYIAAHATISETGGAVYNGDTFAFPLAKGQTLDVENLSSISYTGSVNLNAYGGALDITFANPTVEKTADGWVLTAESVSKPRSGGEPVNYGRIALASLEGMSVEESDGLVSVTFASAQALEGTSNVFGYAAGTDLAAPVATFAVSSEPEPTAPATQATTPGKETTTKPSKPTTQPTSTETPAATPSTQQKTECTVDTTKTRVTSGSLSWGLKSSFTSYITSSIANGSWTLSGVTRDGGAFVFPATGGTFDTATRTGTLYFSGSVHFTGHDGILDLTISNPTLVVNGSTGSVYLTVKGSDMQGNKVDVGRVNFANGSFSTVSVSNGALSVSASSVTLTAAGAQAFAGFYSAGQALDNLNASAHLTAASSCDPVTGEKTYYDAFGNVTTADLANTGASDVAGLAAAAAGFLLLGLAVVAMRRRALL